MQKITANNSTLILRLLTCALLAVALLMTTGVFAADRGISEGKQYLSYPSRADDSEPLLMFFWYGCPACQRVEADLGEELDARGVRRVPLVLDFTWHAAARMFAVLSTMDKAAELHPQIMQAVANGELDATSESALIAFVVGLGIDEEQLRTELASRATFEAVESYDKLAKKFAVTAGPAFVVRGKYYTDASMTGRVSRLQETLNFLTETRF